MNTINFKEKETVYKKIKNTEQIVHYPNYIKQLKKNAFEKFESLNFPTTKHEEWKYTSIDSILKNTYSFFENINDTIEEKTIQPFLIKNWDANVIVIVNGIFNKELSHIISPANEVVIESFQKAYQHHAHLMERYLGKIASYEADIFTSLNTASIQDGLFIYTPDHKKVAKPISIHFINEIKETNKIIQPRLLCVVGKNSQIELIENTHSIGNHIAFTNMITEIALEENAHATCYKIQNDVSTSLQVATTEVWQKKNSSFTHHTITLNGSFTRNNLNIRLNEEYAQANMYGLYILNDKMHVDNHTIVDHIKPNCLSNELYKGIISNKAKGVFNGKIFVRPYAQKTNAFQSNKNILLSSDASMDSKPQLEIWANDVKCSHGSTTGQLDQEAIFYLRSRGIPEQEAKKLLMQAFAKEIIDKIRIDILKIYLEELIISRMQNK